ncbi:MAG: penicillin-binding protein 2 [Pseudomonadales bacterium]|nr:penicillin-binding protein 2 [Pseudomonadales bacterium]
MQYRALKDNAREQRLIHIRTIIAFVIVFILLSVLFSRYFFLQIYHYETYATKSESNRVHLQRLPPKRGLIVDRDHQLVAENQPSHVLSIIRDRVDDLPALLDSLKRYQLIDDDDIARFMKRKKRFRAFEAQPIRFNLNDEDIAKVAANRIRMPGVEVNATLVRHYPQQGDLAHMLGYVGRINERELKQLDLDNYSGTHHIGKIGIEKHYEDFLHGTAGFQNVETDARGRVLRTLEKTPPIPGENIVLHMDLDVQKVALQALGTHRGAVVAIDTTNGGILAAVSTPTFDANAFVNGISHKNYNALRNNLDLPLFNRIIQAQYPPGSTVKPMMSLAGLEEKATFTWSKVADPGWYQLPNDKRYYRDWKRQGHSKFVGFHDALEQSCDVFFYDLAFKLGVKNISKYYDMFGLGWDTGIDVPNERHGINPSPQWKRSQGRGRWYTGDSLNMAIGQGYVLMTPMQLAYMTSIIANRGKRFIPQMVRKLGDNELPPKQRPAIKLGDEQNWEEIIYGMQRVISGKKGTARRIGRGLTYTLAGKSGTAQVVGIKQGERYDAKALKERQRDHALFIGFAPIDKPRIAVAVIVENGQSGSGVAGPIVRKVIDAWMLKVAEQEKLEKQKEEKLKKETKASKDNEHV